MTRRKVLILEDEKAVADLYARELRARGLDAVVCTSFPDARDVLKQEVPDALLTDVRVGAFNGLQLVHLFRSLSPHGTVVVATGHDDPDDSGRSIEARRPFHDKARAHRRARQLFHTSRLIVVASACSTAKNSSIIC